jgi:hypothetical protein
VAVARICEGILLDCVATAGIALLSLEGVVFAPDPTVRIVASVFVAIGVVTLMLLVLPGSRRAMV